MSTDPPSPTPPSAAEPDPWGPYRPSGEPPARAASFPVWNLRQAVRGLLRATGDAATWHASCREPVHAEGHDAGAGPESIPRCGLSRGHRGDCDPSPARGVARQALDDSDRLSATLDELGSWLVLAAPSIDGELDRGLDRRRRHARQLAEAVGHARGEASAIHTAATDLFRSMDALQQTVRGGPRRASATARLDALKRTIPPPSTPTAGL